ncbi:hypothetical protein AVEN_5236-1 [Araneus ventricosus]|uniref:Uncharacterized protein n=1 Tax=Araneus ventricosus TaxID=182803 RepID=A0A4Y2NW72_ARAVE|nr:hypothetical protein AVEN_5236-1 [Araneus ventricosus]
MIINILEEGNNETGDLTISKAHTVKTVKYGRHESQKQELCSLLSGFPGLQILNLIWIHERSIIYVSLAPMAVGLLAFCRQRSKVLLLARRKSLEKGCRLGCLPRHLMKSIPKHSLCCFKAGE